MNIFEYGTDNSKHIVLIHPSLVMWDYFEYVIPLLENEYHLIIPALPGYDESSKDDFSSIEEIAKELEDQLSEKGIREIECIYGCSMGGSIVTRFLSDNRIKMHTAIIDGGITPYQLPWILTRFIALRDFSMIYLGKLGGLKLLEKAFATDEYSKEDLEYVAHVLNHTSPKTIWNTFDSCNNYSMPEKIFVNADLVEYWYAENEEKERKWDIAWFQKFMPDTVFHRFEAIGHGGLAVLKPELFVSEMKRAMNETA